MEVDSLISFEYISNSSVNTPICIFGCLLTEQGYCIKSEMLSWLIDKYQVICVNQKSPGILYEYPALNCAQLTAKKYHCPILYVHTKGAANSHNVYEQAKVRQLWKTEFVDHFDYYYNIVSTDPLAVGAPFVSDAPFGNTWMNGFIAGERAWHNACIEPPKQPLGRYRYECIFRDVLYHPYSRIISHINHANTTQFTQLVNYINEERYLVK
jgi:hypothetical protein